jgi:DNA-binding MarR family transcriptional regulator
VGLSTGGHLVDRLVQAGLAGRAEDAGDRRRTMAHLTPKGEDLYARLLNRTQHLQSLLQRMREDELAALLRGVQALHRAVREENQENNVARQEFDEKTLSNR